MKYLAYCIFSRNGSGQRDIVVQGIDQRATYVVENNDLCAVISAVPDGELPNDKPAILRYHHVVESYHYQFGAIPLRFGVVVDDEAEIACLLQTQGDRYNRLLKELANCVEMGIRVICSRAHRVLDSNKRTATAWDTKKSETGAAYLAARKAHLDALRIESERTKETIARYSAVFDGLYVKFKSEEGKGGAGGAGSCATIVSLYFLVPRHRVTPFYCRYDALNHAAEEKIMVSGPWPPYNFVLPDD